MIGNVAGIVFDAENKAGLTAAHKRQAKDVQSRYVDDTAVVLDLPLAVEDIDVEPAVIGTETGCPDNRFDVGLVEIE